VHANIGILGLTLFSKDNVGGACAVVEESAGSPAGTRITALQFVSGSWPERLKGFNRFGMTQEAVREEGALLAESAYLSFMTSSPEKNFDQARKAFLDAPAALAITAAHGAATRSGYGAAIDRLTAPAGFTWQRCSELMERLRGQVSPLVMETAHGAGGGALPTFLFAARRAMLEGRESAQSAFVHNGKLFLLRTRLTQAKEPRLQLTIGRIAEQGTGHESEFRVWHRPGDPATLPVRIEFRPKSYLHLVFEHDAAAGGPAVPPLIPQEPA
jgi:hypothetical protein